jgi:hypothetical protein
MCNELLRGSIDYKKSSMSSGACGGLAWVLYAQLQPLQAPRRFQPIPSRHANSTHQRGEKSHLELTAPNGLTHMLSDEKREQRGLFDLKSEESETFFLLQQMNLLFAKAMGKASVSQNPKYKRERA